MARRVTSRQLVGRSDQLAALRSATDTVAVGESRVILIAGDAGIGKTRLVTEAADQALAAGFVVAVGGCVQLGELSVAYAPLVEALRDLRGQLGENEFATFSGPGAVEIGALLGGAAGPSSSGSGPLFEHLLAFLTRLGQRRPVMLVFEDLHWADASTRDLVAFLGRNLRDTPVAFVLTYRADELHRRHPLRPMVADLERDPRVERIVLGGLDRGELAGLLAEICDDVMPDDAVDEMLARSDGNPFYVEELVAAGGVQRGLPATLADVILARVARLSKDAQSELHKAAVLGIEVDDALLAQVTGQSLDTVAAGLREAVFDQLLVIEGDTCRFRHALVREALYDDLLPGERERLHVAAAQALESPSRLGEQARWAQIAYHWDAAAAAPKAFRASVRAAVEAEKVHALADAAEQFERALRLYDRVPDAEGSAGMTRADLLLRTADAVQASRPGHRSIELIEAALEELDGAAPEQRALALERLGRSNYTQHRATAAVAAYEQAVAILDGRPPSRERAFALAALAQSLMERSRFRETVPLLRQAIEIAEAVDARDVQGHASCSLGVVLVGLGNVQDAIDALYRARELSSEFGTAEDVNRMYVNLSDCLYLSGRYDEAAQVGADGVEYAIRTGHRRFSAPAASNLIAALVASGRWAEADRAHADPRVPTDDPYHELSWLPLLLRRGRYDDARELVGGALDATADSDDVQYRARALMLAAELALADQAHEEARRLLADALALAVPTDDQHFMAQALSVAISVEADRAAAAHGPHADREIAGARAVADRLAEQARQFAADFVARGGSLLPGSHAWLATAAVDHERVLGHDTAEGWAGVAGTWDALGQPVEAAVARCRQADALLRTRGDRSEAAAIAREALRVADDLGAMPLATQVRQLAQRGRLDLADQQVDIASDPVAELNLTRRELDVMHLLAEGRTNRQIGESLFISEKTASVHVTNLLRKLGVHNRVEAASIAQRVGL
ncbi:MAG TPA: AAA family ATPase [Jatrophihabitantaceae bacterium]